MYTEYSPPRPKFHSVSLYDQPFSRYRFFENRKCTEWPQNDLKHLSVKNTLCTLNTHTRGPNFIPFCSTTSCFRDIRLSIIGNAPNDPRMTLITEVFKSTLCTLNGHSWGQISLRFALRSLVFQIIEVFGFSIGYNGEFKKIVKNRNLKISKIENSTFVRTAEKKIQKKCERI